MSCVDQGAFRLIGAACKQARQAAVDGSIESERVSSTVTGLSVGMSLVGPLKQRTSAARSWSYTQYIIVVLCRNLLIVESKIFCRLGLDILGSYTTYHPRGHTENKEGEKSTQAGVNVCCFCLK